MIKYRYIFASVVLVILGLLIWRTSILFTNLSSLFSNMETTTKLDLNTDNDEFAINLNKPPQLAGNNVGHYETIEETIARIKKDVIVTGTVTGMPGEEIAFFQIEGMEDRAFQINTQLMDGFIIKEITETHVILKNQIGEETFILNVQA